MFKESCPDTAYGFGLGSFEDGSRPMDCYLGGERGVGIGMCAPAEESKTKATCRVVMSDSGLYWISRPLPNKVVALALGEAVGHCLLAGVDILALMKSFGFRSL